jgi:hypothetical protein
VWADLHSARENLRGILEEAAEEDLGRPFPVAVGSPERTVYSQVCLLLSHERRHAREIREATEPDLFL